MATITLHQLPVVTMFTLMVREVLFRVQCNSLNQMPLSIVAMLELLPHLQMCWTKWSPLSNTSHS